MQVEFVEVAQLARHQLHIIGLLGRILQLCQQSFDSLIIVFRGSLLLVRKSGALLPGVTIAAFGLFRLLSEQLLNLWIKIVGGLTLAY